MLQRQALFIVITLVIGSAAWAEDTAKANVAILSAPLQAAPSQNVQLEDKRVFGVIPNNRTTEASLPFAPINSKRKMTIALKDSFALPLGLTSSVFASVYQWEDQNPSFGQGMAGYAKRLGASYGDLVIGNMMTEGVMPALLHEDPRYFRAGTGSKWSRVGSALAQILVTRTDSGRRTFNFSEWGGNAAAVALSNAWYPDTRTASENIEKLVIQCASDGLSNVLKEFWPDVKRHFDRKREVKRERELERITAPAPASVIPTDAGSGQN